MLGRTLLGAMAALWLVACAAPADPESRNLLVNGGFDAGDEPWATHTFAVWRRRAFDVHDPAIRPKGYGDRTAVVMLVSAEPHEPRQLMGLIQDVAAAEMPRRLRGRYRVSEWLRGTDQQYVQVVVIVFGAANAPKAARATNHQLRIPLAGITAPAFEVRNAKWVFAGPREPRVGQWVDFDLDLHALFTEHWGAVPHGFTKLRVLFEARWDGANENDGPTRAVVLFDDLYLGD